MNFAAREIHEEKFVRAFLLKERQERSLEMLTNPSRRGKFTNQLAHFKWLDSRYAHPLPSGVHTPIEISSFLIAKRANEKAWAISENKSIDGLEVELSSLLKTIVGYGMGTIVSCIPGELGYFEGEVNERYLLERRC